MESTVETLCRNKERELLDKYFPSSSGAFTTEASETIGEYTLDLPLRIEAEFREFLEGIWQQHSDEPLVLEEATLRHLLTDNKREGVQAAHKEAAHISLRERIAKTNHKDVSHYKALLRDYTKELLMIMRIDFLEEITGKHINCKAFD